MTGGGAGELSTSVADCAFTTAPTPALFDLLEFQPPPPPPITADGSSPSTFLTVFLASFFPPPPPLRPRLVRRDTRGQAPPPSSLPSFDICPKPVLPYPPPPRETDCPTGMGTKAFPTFPTFPAHLPVTEHAIHIHKPDPPTAGTQ